MVDIERVAPALLKLSIERVRHSKTAALHTNIFEKKAAIFCDKRLFVLQNLKPLEESRTVL